MNNFISRIRRKYLEVHRRPQRRWIIVRDRRKNGFGSGYKDRQQDTLRHINNRNTPISYILEIIYIPPTRLIFGIAKKQSA